MSTLMTTSEDLNKDTILFNHCGGRGKMVQDKSILERYGKGLLILSILLSFSISAIQFGPRYFYRFLGYLWLEKFDSRFTEQQISTIQKGIQGLKAKIVWSSSRTGNHEIFLMTLPDLKMYQLTHNSQVDYYPRFSPDGEKIIFCRSQRPWVSERENDPWDVYLFSLTNNRERLVVRDANWPQWVSSSRISFVRKNRIMVKDLETGKEEMILDGTQDPVSAEIGTPEFSPQDPNLLAFSPRGKMDGVFILDRIKKRFIKFGQGCEITWVPPGQEVIWVEGGGNGGTQVFKSALTPVQPIPFIDLPGRYSHEYFPRLARDGKWLVWAASEGGHEHDIADYEIFLWKVGTPFNKAIRLTYNPANDRWPDIFIEK
jgi:hypothetical protein